MLAVSWLEDSLRWLPYRRALMRRGALPKAEAMPFPARAFFDLALICSVLFALTLILKFVSGVSLVAGVVAAHSVREVRHREDFYLSGIRVVVAYAVAILVADISNADVGLSTLTRCGWGGLNAIVSMGIVIVALPLFERSGSAFALLAVPLGTEPGAVALEASQGENGISGSRTSSPIGMRIMMGTRKLPSSRVSCSWHSRVIPKGFSATPSIPARKSMLRLTPTASRS